MSDGLLFIGQFGRLATAWWMCAASAGCAVGWPGSSDVRFAAMPSAAAAKPAPSRETSTRPAVAPAIRSHFSISNSQLEAELGDLASGVRGAAAIHLLDIGRARSGAVLGALAVSSRMGASPDQRATVLLIGQQHGDEPGGAEALLALARDAAEGRLTDVLRRVDLVIVPRLNPDGASVGQRGNAEGIDIDRDHLLLQTPEVQALAGLIRERDPAVVIDLREYDASASVGASQVDVVLRRATAPAVPPFIARAAREWFERPLEDALEREGWRWGPYPNARAEGIAPSGTGPDNAVEVAGLMNSVSLSIAARSSGSTSTYAAPRERAEFSAIRSVLTSAAAHAQDLVKLRHYVRAEVSAQACRGEIVPEQDRETHGAVDSESMPAAPSGSARSRPCGYWLSADASEAVGRLRQLGVEVDEVRVAASLLGDLYREREPGDGSPEPVKLVDALIEMPAGSYVVPLTQPLANIAIAALEPDTAYSYYAHHVIGQIDQVARLRALPEPTEADTQRDSSTEPR